MTGEYPAQKASNAENVSIWWRYHAVFPLGRTYKENAYARLSNVRVITIYRLRTHRIFDWIKLAADQKYSTNLMINLLLEPIMKYLNK